METVILVLAIATLVVGNLLGIVQDNVKRILAYSSIAHAGYVLLGIYAARTIDGATTLPSAVPFYLLTYVIATVGAFGVIALLGARGEEDMSLDHLAGLGKRHPVLGVVLTLCVLSLAGVPPLVGFMGKLRLFQQLLEADTANLIWVVVAILASVVSLYYYLRILLATWFREPEGERALAIAGAPGHLVLGVTAVMVMVLGVFPGMALDAADFAAKRVVPTAVVQVAALDCAPAEVAARTHDHPGLPELQQPSCGARADRRLLKGTPMDPARKDLYRLIRNDMLKAEPAE
jgi:NADH-quinone oxidoreductase subunit N